MKILPQFKCVYLILSVALLLTISGNQSVSAVVTPPLTKCNIEVNNPHISKNLLRTRGLIAVKVNARSQCDRPMRNLLLTVEIFKEGLLIDHLVARGEVAVTGLVYANRIVKNQRTYVTCKNNSKTTYYGLAYAQALINGKTVKTLKVVTEKSVSFKCGT